MIVNFLKRIGSVLADIIFFTSLLAVAGMVALVVLYYQQNDIAILNTLLQTQLTPTMLVTYGVVLLLFLHYFTIIPLFIGGTIGQTLFGLSFHTEQKLTWWKLFLKHVVGLFWDVILFPYTIFAGFTKKNKISTNISGISVAYAPVKKKFMFYVCVIFATLSLAGTIAAGTYVQKTGITPLMEKYTNYEKQVNYLVEKQAYQDASDMLVKYKQYNGETSIYWYSLCLINGNLTTETSTHETCAKAAEQNKDDKAKMQQINTVEARLYAANGNYTEAEKRYAILWNEMNVRSLEMKDYVYVLSELGKNEEAGKVLGEIEKVVPAENVAVNRDIAVLYERLGDKKKALEKYQSLLAGIKEGTEQDVAGELHYYIGVILYEQSKTDEAKTHFEAAKSLNQDYAELAESYIILINKLSKSIVK